MQRKPRKARTNGEVYATPESVGQVFIWFSAGRARARLLRGEDPAPGQCYERRAEAGFAVRSLECITRAHHDASSIRLA